jgi:hypothetical protein
MCSHRGCREKVPVTTRRAHRLFLVDREDTSVGTPSERLEAEIWLDATGRQLSDEQRRTFFAHADVYYRRNPTSDRGADFLGTLREDDAAFARILESICPSCKGPEDADA